ncbi:hypothetical protein [Nocardioides nitrophenolicus]|uniref:hypothetical protein n=1 Tax=Nocardioides nitrophenolicus TaxID=60489 RepID=UPI00195EDDCE|nr:hypothetical protein [Nocardioides nitrophenolicus]MBM7516335.1 hypothetical protein [Nocardioides nitrophenolicus]
MTDVVPPPPWRPSRRQLGIGLAAVATLAVLASPLVVWWVGYRATLAVVAFAGVPDCRGTEPAAVDDAFGSAAADGGFRRTAITMRPGSACTLSVKVVNESGHDIEVGGSRIDGFGGGTGAAVTDSSFGEARTLAPGQEMVLWIRVEYRDPRCDGGGQVGLGLEPTVRLRDTIATHELVVAGLPLIRASCAG